MAAVERITINLRHARRITDFRQPSVNVTVPIARRRQRRRSWQPNLDPQRVFIDETRIKTNMAPLRCWGPTGKRLRGFAPHDHWRAPIFLGAMRLDRLAAPCVFDGSINGQCSRGYVE